jgi:D-galactarolactone cycloisomerase
MFVADHSALNAQRGLCIQAIEATPIQALGTLRLNTKLVTKGGQIPRTAIVTRILTREGSIGESVTTIGYGIRAPDVAAVITEEIAPRLAGLDAFSTDACWEKMVPVTFSIMRDRRIGVRAQACVDAAIWDTVGKALDVPLYKLWGGYRNELPIVELGGFWEEHKSFADYGRDMERLRARGVGGCKFKVGKLSPLSPKEDAKRLRAAREGAGPDFLLIADANQGWTVDEALAFAREVEDLDLLWFEEPCHWQNDRRGMADIRSRATVKVAAGQCELTVEACRDLMLDRAIDVCNFDAAWGGGPTPWRRMASVAHAFGVSVSQHQEPQLGAHLSAAVSNGTILEVYSPEQDPIWHEMFPNRPAYHEGHYRLPDTPGWGLEIDRKLVERWRQ